MRFLKSSTLATIIIVLFVLSGSFFIVNQGQKALVLQLGKINVDKSGTSVLYEPGLHWKIPFVNTSKKFDSRIQGFTSGSFSALTAKQTFLVVEYYAKWRITNFSLYYKRTAGSSVRAEQLMEPKINDIVRAQFGKHTSDDIISSERQAIMDGVLKQANAKIEQDYGIHIIDVRLQQASLPPKVMKSVFSRMASERKQFANNKRAEGLKVAESIKAQADKQVVVIKAQANEQAASIRAKGEREAASIYAQAYGSDPKFYSLYRSLLAYQSSFVGKNDVLVISPDSQFFSYFNHSQGGSP